MSLRLLPAAGVLSAGLFAQLIPSGQPIPRMSKPPVVFVNGYQNDCSATFSDTFGIADQVLQANGKASVFFNNCNYGKPSIEVLGNDFGTFLAGLKYTDGTSVDQVDVVAHSMGGLIVRSYLSGKQETDRLFTPPGQTPIRKAVFLGTPHFGTPVAMFFGLGLNSQVDELSSGSHFLFALNTWNDNTDDLRGIDAAAVVGNGGTGLAVAPGFDDGVVAVTSASLGFYMPGRTRVIPACHVEAGGLVSIFQLCPSNAKGIARIRSASDPSAQIVVSFLNGTADWQNVGQAAEQNAAMSSVGAVEARSFASNEDPAKLPSATISNGSTSKALNETNDEIGYTDSFPAGAATISANTSVGNLNRTVNVLATTGQAYILKPGPNVARVIPSAAAGFPLTFAPRSIVAIYGGSLAAGIQQALSSALPTILSDVQVKVGGQALPLYYASPGQVNGVLPDSASGLIQLQVTNGGGSSTVNLMVEPTRPLVYSLDSSGTGPGAVVNFRTGQAVGAGNALRGGDYAEIFLTGLGAITQRNDGLYWANISPTVTIGGADCPVTFAGAAPGSPGLDQINCIVPFGVPSPAAPLIVTSGGRTSNTVTVVVE